MLKPSAYSPLYSPLDSLVDLACRDGVDIRPTLLRVITDLYVQKPTHTAEEVTQYVELALGLVGAVDAATRAAVLARLSNYGAAPVAVLHRLMALCPEAAAAGLTTAPTAAPVDEPPAAKAPAQDLAELFFSAGSEERHLILINLDAAAEPALPPPARPAIDVIRALEDSALLHNPVEFSRLLEGGLGVARALAERIVEDSSGEGIVVAAKALGMEADALQRILLLLNPAIGQSIPQVFRLARLFEDITRAAAERMVMIWRRTAERPRPKHAPVYWDDEQSSARVRATPGRHHAARPGSEQRPRHRFGTR